MRTFDFSIPLRLLLFWLVVSIISYISLINVFKDDETRFSIFFDLLFLALILLSKRKFDSVSFGYFGLVCLFLIFIFNDLQHIFSNLTVSAYAAKPWIYSLTLFFTQRNTFQKNDAILMAKVLLSLFLCKYIASTFIGIDRPWLYDENTIEFPLITLCAICLYYSKSIKMISAIFILGVLAFLSGSSIALAIFLFTVFFIIIVSLPYLDQKVGFFLFTTALAFTILALMIETIGKEELLLLITNSDRLLRLMLFYSEFSESFWFGYGLAIPAEACLGSRIGEEYITGDLCSPGIFVSRLIASIFTHGIFVLIVLLFGFAIGLYKFCGNFFISSYIFCIGFLHMIGSNGFSNPFLLLGVLIVGSVLNDYGKERKIKN